MSPTTTTVSAPATAALGTCAPGKASAVEQTDDTTAELRTRIDEIDQALMDLWRERAALSQRVGAARVAAGGTRLVLSREREILDRFHRELGPLGTQLGLLILRAGRGAL